MNETWMVNPASGDYVLDATGKPVIDTSLLTPSYFRLKIPRAGWMYGPDPTYGSDYQASRLKETKDNISLAIQIAQKALKPTIDDGRAQSIDVSENNGVRGGLELQINIVEAGGQPTAFNFDPVGP